MSHDITRPSEHPTGDGIAHPANPSEDLTNAFNALFYAAYTRLQGGLPKVDMMRFLERHAATLTTYAAADEENFFTRFNPFALRHIADTAAEPKPYDCEDLALIMPEVVALQDLHRDRCTDHTHPHGGGPCFQCGRTEAEIEARASGGRFVCDCENPALHPHDVICRCGRDDDDEAEPVACCDRHALNPDNPDECAAWLNSPDTPDGCEPVDEAPTVLEDGYGIAPRLCHCGEEALDQTGDCAPFCSAACADNEPEGWDYTTNADGDRCPSPCGGHWGGCEDCLNGPVASSKTPAKFADARAVWLDRQESPNGAGWEDREAWKDANPTAWEDFMDGQKAKVKDHITHALNADKKTLSRLVLGWDELNCPNCGGESRLEFHEEGGGCVRVECGGLIPCFDEVVL